jgi:hypothetical protein
LTLLDPDRVEAHNLGEMDLVTGADVGLAKVEALAARLNALQLPAPLQVTALTCSIAQPEGLAAAKVCEILVCCADNDAARLAAGLVASLYHRILLDIGAGVFYPSLPVEAPSLQSRMQALAAAGASLSALLQAALFPEHLPPPPPRPDLAGRRLGADVRLVLPGDGCLLCRGGLVHYAQAVEDLSHSPAPELVGRGEGEGWRQQRAGSLRSLNQVAAGLGLQQLQDLAAGRVARSQWLEMEVNPAGQAVLSYPPLPAAAGCPLCARSGEGDAAIAC